MQNDNTIAIIHQMIEDIQAQLARLQHLVQQIGPVGENVQLKEKAEREGRVLAETHSKEVIVEGVFDGQHMVGPDGKIYSVPANYASKSKLLEGDLMKLTIKEDGSFLYKQIGPVERKREVGTLIKDEQGMYRAVVKNGRSYKLLTASVTYYKGETGDSVTLLLPEDGQTAWAAVETIMKGVPAAFLPQEQYHDNTLPLLLDNIDDLSTGERHLAGVADDKN